MPRSLPWHLPLQTVHTASCPHLEPHQFHPAKPLPAEELQMGINWSTSHAN